MLSESESVSEIERAPETKKTKQKDFEHDHCPIFVPRALPSPPAVDTNVTAEKHGNPHRAQPHSDNSVPSQAKASRIPFFLAITRAPFRGTQASAVLPASPRGPQFTIHPPHTGFLAQKLHDETRALATHRSL